MYLTVKKESEPYTVTGTAESNYPLPMDTDTLKAMFSGKQDSLVSTS